MQSVDTVFQISDDRFSEFGLVCSIIFTGCPFQFCRSFFFCQELGSIAGSELAGLECDGTAIFILAGKC